MITVDQLRYESPIEQSLAVHLLPRLRESVTIETQRPMSGRGSNYRADFYLQSHGRTVVIECDGKEYHDFNDDLRRDAVMLNDCGVTDVLRFRGTDIYFDAACCLWAIERFAPFLLDGAAAPLSLREMLAQSMLLTGREDKPLVRCLHPIASFNELTADEKRMSTWSPLGHTSDRQNVVAQFKTQNWDRVRPGPKSWLLGDYVQALANELHADRATNEQ